MEPVNDCVYYRHSVRSQYLNTNQEMGLHQTLVGGPEVVIYPCATPYDHRTIGRGEGGGGRGVLVRFADGSDVMPASCSRTCDSVRNHFPFYTHLNIGILYPLTCTMYFYCV